MESIIAQIVNFFKLGEIRPFLNKSFEILVVILLVFCAFLAGRLSTFMNSRPTFTYVSKEVEERVWEEEKDALFAKVSTSTIVASRTGKKYYFVWCKGVANLKESNKIYFDSEDQAKKRGLTLANNCK